jgi:hypothetical protein
VNVDVVDIKGSEVKKRKIGFIEAWGIKGVK